MYVIRTSLFSIQGNGIFQYNPSKLGYDTPAVIMFENAGDYKKAFTRQAETTYTFDLFVMDRFSADDCKRPIVRRGK